MIDTLIWNNDEPGLEDFWNSPGPPELELSESWSPAHSDSSLELPWDLYFPLNMDPNDQIPLGDLQEPAFDIDFDIFMNVESICLQPEQIIPHSTFDGLQSNGNDTISQSTIDSTRYRFSGPYKDAPTLMEDFFGQMLERPQLAAFYHFLESLRAQFRKKKIPSLKAVIDTIIDTALKEDIRGYLVLINEAVEALRSASKNGDIPQDVLIPSKSTQEDKNWSMVFQRLWIKALARLNQEDTVELTKSVWEERRAAFPENNMDGIEYWSIWDDSHPHHRIRITANMRFKCAEDDFCQEDEAIGVWSIRKHIKAVHARPFHCQQCQRAFSQGKDLDRHNSDVHDDSPNLYRCELADLYDCEFETKRRDNLRSHYKNKHKLKDNQIKEIRASISKSVPSAGPSGVRKRSVSSGRRRGSVGASSTRGSSEA